MIKRALILSNSQTNNSQGRLNKWAKAGQINAPRIRLKPQRVIKPAKGTINRLANIVTGENILK